MTAPLTLRAGRTLSRESPLTGGVVTLYKITPEGRPDVAIGSVMNVELACLIVEAVNARAVAIEGVVGEVRADERERIAKLAEEHDACYTPACRPGECGPLCNRAASFADLIRSIP